MRIVRLANFVAPRSGGLRTSLAELGAGYLAAGHEPVLVIPGERDGDERCAQGRVITLRAPRVPFTGGYRVLWRRRRLAALLAALRPDALEVSDRTTLRWTGAWAREHGVPAVMVSHESVTALLKLTCWDRLGPSAVQCRRRLAQPAHRARLPPGHLHHRLGGGRVRADRRGQRGPRSARRGPGHVQPSRRGGSGPGTSARARSCWCTAAGSRRRRGRSAR